VIRSDAIPGILISAAHIISLLSRLLVLRLSAGEAVYAALIGGSQPTLFAPRLRLPFIR
jgi:hypothetical protein